MSGFVEHGHAIWKLALAALVALGAAAALWAPVLGTRLRAAIARRALGSARSVQGLADGMVVTLAGALRARGVHHALTGEAARTVVLGRSVTHLRTDDVLLAVGGTEVELSGPLDIALGSDESTARVGAESGHARVRTRVVRSGDEVRVRGTLLAFAGDSPDAGYRTAARRFRLVPEPPAACLRVVAEGGPGARDRRGRALLSGAGGGALAFVLLFVIGGAAAARIVARAPSDPLDPALRPGWGMSATAWAAATPFHRGALFDALGSALRDRPRDSLVAATLALASRSDADCTAATRALVRAGQLRRAAIRGARCAAPSARLDAARARVALADYAAADRLFRALPLELDPPDHERALLAQVLGPSPSPWTVRDDDRCVLVSAAVATTGLGRDFARDQLRRALRDGGPSRRDCALLLAAHLSGRDREEVLAGTVEPAHPLVTLLRIAADPARPEAFPGEEPEAMVRADVALLDGTAEARSGLAPALERQILERPLAEGAPAAAWRRRAWLASDVAAIASLAGDHLAARQALEVAGEATSATGAWRPALGAAVVALGAAIERRAGAPHEAVPVPAVASPALEGRDELRAWARWSGASRSRARAADPLAHLVTTSRQLDVARSLGDAESIEELERTLERLRTVLSRPELALTAALLPLRVR